MSSRNVVLRAARYAGAFLLPGLGLCFSFEGAARSQDAASAPPAERSSTFVGAAECALCHRTTHYQWDLSRHSKMVRPATDEGVIGDFGAGQIRLRGDRYRLSVRDGNYYITESYLTGKEVERRVDYTLGNRRIQHYLTTLEDGRIVVLPPSWDETRQEWFHNREIVGMPNPDQGLAVQVWNKNCFGCHVSQQKKTYDVETKTYTSEWLDFGANCEGCHGPGSRHVERYKRLSLYKDDPNSYIVTQTTLGHIENSMVCAQCHSFRDVMAPGYTSGEDYFDYFLPLLEYSQEPSDDPVWYVDGRTRRFSTNALGLWQSECFVRGEATCTGCHMDSHAPEIEKNKQLVPTNSSLCTGCHTKIGEDVPAHTHHEPASTGSQCVECHMPKSVVSIKAEMRDHSISIPVPENTVRHGIPNACNLCHTDKKADWAVEVLESWYPGSQARRKLIRRAEVYARARSGDIDVVPELIALADQQEEGPLPRANAIGHLGRFSSPQVVAALLDAMKDEHPLVRSIAALKLGQIEGTDLNRIGPVLANALGDERRIVRMNALLSLLNRGVRGLKGEAGRLFENAKMDHVNRAAFYPDDPQAQLNLGKFYVMFHDAEGAARAFDASYRLAPEQPGIKYFLALARVGQQRYEDARKLLKGVDKSDPYKGDAKELLQKLKQSP